MSLINDALKQTKQARPQSPPSSPPPLPPVESTAQGSVSWLMPAVIVLLLAVGGIFVGLSLNRHAPPDASVPPPVAVIKTQQLEPATIVLQVVTNLPPDSNAVVVVPPKPPEPKLQGILFAAARPCAIVSDRTVFVGDYVGEFRVATILKDRITLQSKAETNVLSLSPQ
jgi:hypothetical protein